MVLVAGGVALVSTAGPAAAVAAVPGGYIVNFQSDTGVLSTVGLDGVAHPTTVHMAANTSPAIALLPNGSTLLAYQSDTGLLMTLGADGTPHATPASAHMAPGTSPSITVQPNGTAQVAFQTDLNKLNMYSVGGSTLNVGDGMAPGTSPAVVATSDTNFTFAFQRTAGALSTKQFVIPAGGGTTQDRNVPMAPGSSPVLVSPSVVAYQGSDGMLGTFNLVTSTATNLHLGMAAGTSPASTTLHDGQPEIAYNDSSGSLAVEFGGSSHSLNVAMAPHTSPAIAALPYPSPATAMVFQGSNGELWQAQTDFSHNASRSTGLHMAAGSSPIIPTAVSTDIASPTNTSVQTNGTSATVTWTDQSTNENSFTVNRGLLNEYPRTVGHVTSTTTSGTGTSYSFTDTNPPPAGTRRCYQITATNVARDTSGVSKPVCTGAPVPLPTGHGITNFTDSEGDVGLDSSTVTGADGLQIVSYFRANSSALMVAHCRDIECSSVSKQVLDPEPTGTVGLRTSIKIGSDGLPLISYVSLARQDNIETRDLRVAHCDDVACFSAHHATVDTTSNVDGVTSLTIGGDGLGLIVYTDTVPGSQNTGAVKVAHCASFDCSGVHVATVDANGSTVAPPSITTGADGLGLVSYSDATGHLKVMACGDPDCGSGTNSVVDASGEGVSITTGLDGLGLLVYSRQPTAGVAYQLVVAHCDNASCTSVTPTVVDTGIQNRAQSSIAIGVDGNGIVAYYDPSRQNLKAAHCADATCSSAVATNLDEFGGVGFRPSLATGSDGLPFISYRDDTNKVLKTVHCADVACVEPLEAPF
ncbi:hypothetical protein [Kribbella sp. NBC_00359]|uniref:hypothetical protein n=1 Tax=Kribbella sp. NBC_00359 TaxID=2975966 RepID=UPI002E1E1572